MGKTETRDGLGVARVALLKAVRYKARINFKGWQLNLGRFPDVHSAKLAYDQALLALRGPDNPTNYPVGSHPLNCPAVQRRIEEFTSMLQAKGVVPAGHFSSMQGNQQAAAGGKPAAATAAVGPVQPPEPCVSGHNSSATMMTSGSGPSGWVQQHSSASCAGGSISAVAAASSPPAAQLLGSFPACGLLDAGAGTSSSTTMSPQLLQQQPTSCCWLADSTPDCSSDAAQQCSSNTSITSLGAVAFLGDAAPAAAAAGPVATALAAAGAEEEEDDDDFLRLLDTIQWDDARDDSGEALLQQCLPSSPAVAARPAAGDAMVTTAQVAASTWPSAGGGANGSCCGVGGGLAATARCPVPQHHQCVGPLSNSAPPQLAAPFISRPPLTMPGGSSSSSSSSSQASAGQGNHAHLAAGAVGRLRTALLNLHRYLGCTGAGGALAERAAALWLSGFSYDRPDNRAILAVLGRVLGEICSMLSTSPAAAISPGSSSSLIIRQLLGASAAVGHQVASSSVLRLVEQAEQAMGSLQLQLQALAVAHLQQQVQLRIMQLGGSACAPVPAPSNSMANLLYQWILGLPGVSAAGSPVDAAVVRVAQKLASEILLLMRARAAPATPQ